jgi:hypothetical protein
VVFPLNWRIFLALLCISKVIAQSGCGLQPHIEPEAAARLRMHIFKPLKTLKGIIHLIIPKSKRSITCRFFYFLLNIFYLRPALLGAAFAERYASAGRADGVSALLAGLAAGFTEACVAGFLP